MNVHSVHCVGIVLFGLVAGVLQAADEPTGESEDVSFVAQVVAPILQEKCLECHDASMQMAELRLDSRDAMLDAGVLVPGDVDNSLLVQRLTDRDWGILMPPTGPLDAAEIESLAKWVEAGAVWPQDVKLVSADNNLSGAAQSSPIFSVLRHNDVDALRELLVDSSRAQVTDQHGATPLMHAALYTGEQSVRLLLDAGADPNVADRNGMTPLMYAAGGGLAKVRLLLDNGAKVNAQSKLGRNALLIAAAFAGNSDVVRALLDAGADVSYADRRGWTALTLAARTGDRKLVQTLLDAGGDVQGGDPNGLSPGTSLTQAAWAGDLRTAALLLARGAKSNKKSIDSSLIYAATHGNRELVELLLQAGADPHANVVTNYVPESPILAAAYSDSLNTGIVEVLLEHRVDVDKKDNRDETPLSIARQRGPTAIVKLLSRRSASPQPKGDVADRVVVKSDDAAPEKNGDETAIKSTVQKSISLLQSCGPQFFAKSGCVACHQQTASALVVELARERGFAVDSHVARQQIKLTSVDLRRKRVGFLQRIKIGGTTHRLAYLLWGLASANYSADEITDAAYYELAGLQLGNGSWVSDAHRPPSEYSPVTATAVSLHALQQYSPPGLKTTTAQRVARATQWLVSATPVSNAEKSFRLLGLGWGKADPTHIAEAKRELLEDQSPDGGWAQLPALPPDAYATGLTLYALSQAGGLSATDPVYRKGVEFLMKTVQPDGSWHVRSRSFKFQPYFESGFPHGHDQWISAAATGWATMALLQTIAPTPTDSVTSEN